MTTTLTIAKDLNSEMEHLISIEKEISESMVIIKNIMKTMNNSKAPYDSVAYVSLDNTDDKLFIARTKVLDSIIKVAKKINENTENILRGN